MAVEWYECKRKGEEIKDLHGRPLACKYCVRIEYDRERRYVNVVKTMLLPNPRPPYSMIFCPATNIKKLEEAIKKGDVWKVR
jgi:hypothetical protein